MKQRVLTLIVCKAMLALMMTACSSSFATSQPPTPTPMPSGMVDVGGYELFYTCSGQGSPEEPKLVVDAILKVVNEARSR